MSTQETGACDIRGMDFLHPNILLLTDLNNQCVKRVDIDTGAFTGYLSLPAFPWDITSLGLNQAAVTLSGIQIIQVISTKPDLSRLRTITVDDDRRGIC